MDENNNKLPVNKPERTRQQRIEEFLLNPDKVVFESIEDFEGAVQELLDILSAVDLSKLEMLEGEDGYTPVRGKDYMTEEDMKILEDFILSKIPKLGEDLPTTDQVQAYIQNEIAKIPRIKGDRGEALRFSQLTDEEKAELKGKDGSELTGEQVIEKLRLLPKNQKLKISDVRGLENVLRGLVDTAEEFELLKERFEKQNFVITSSPTSGGSSGGGAGSVDSVTGANGIEVDNTDPANPVVKLTATNLAKLGFITVTQAVDLDAIEIQAAAGAAAKVKTDFITVTQAVNLDTIETNSDASKIKTDFLTVTAATDLDTMRARVNDLDAAVVLRGSWAANAGTFPGGGTAQAGSSYIVSVAGTVNGIDFAVNDRIVAILDNASTTVYASNWLKLDYTDQVLSVAGLTGAIASAALKTALVLVKADVGLGNVDNTSDASKPVSTAQQTALDLKANLASPALTGTPTAPTAAAATNTTQLATTAHVFAERSNTRTATNLRVTARIGTEASNATPTPNADTSDQHNITALAAAAAFAAPSGTPTDGQRLTIRIKDNGTARALTWNAIYRAIGITLPTTTVISKTLYIGMIYNAADTKWDVLATGQEA